MDGNFPTLDAVVNENKENFSKLKAIQNKIGTIIQNYDKKKTPDQIVKIHTTEKSGISLISTNYFSLWVFLEISLL